MPKAASRRGRPTYAEAANLDERLREAAIVVFLENGYDGTTMEAIARSARVAKGTLYARYSDKRTLFATVIPWAMSRYDRRSADDEPIPDDDLAGALTAIGRAALARVTDQDSVRLNRLAMNESARFPEFAVSAESMTWSATLRAVMDVLQRHAEAGTVVVKDIEITAEHFLAMVEAMPARLADFGIFRAPEQGERHLQHAVELLLDGILPR
jgi:AcrR family transcriptional regulator